MNINKYTGIASANGLECITPYDEKTFGMAIVRAEANDQRHSVAFTIELEEPMYDALQEMINEGDAEVALIAIKNASGIQFPSNKFKPYSKNWDIIPNTKLDPHA